MAEAAEKIETTQTSLPLTETRTESPAREQRQERSDPLVPRKRDTKSEIRAAWKEVEEKHAKPKPNGEDKTAKAPEKPAATAGERERNPDGTFAPKSDDTPKSTVGAKEPAKAEPAADKPEIPTTEKPEGTTAGASKPAAGPPPSWSQDAKTAWTTLPPAIQAAVSKREQEFSDGIKAKSDELKRYQPIEQALAPHRSIYQQMGVSDDAAAIKALLAWEATIRNNPAEGIRLLARNYGVDLSTMAQPRAGGQQPQETTQPDALPPIDPRIARMFQQFGSVLQAQQTVQQQQQQAAINSQLAEFAKDHPHFDRLKVSMGQLMHTAAQIGQDMSLKDAYDKALWADPELREQILQEREAKAQADRDKAAREAEEKRKAEAKKKAEEDEQRRQAAISPRGTTPSTAGGSRMAGRKPLGKSVRETLNESLAAQQGGRA